MHRDILKCLVFLLVFRRLVSCAGPAPDPWRSRAWRSRAGAASDPRPACDVIDRGQRVTRPRAASTLAGPADPADPAGAVTDSSASRGRGRRRGGRGRGRRRGCRGGKVWRAGTGNNDLLVGHINIQSIKNKMIDLRYEVDLHNYDAISINETWLRKATTGLMRIPNYTFLRADRTVKPLGFGGVAVLVRDSLDARIVQKPAAVNDSKIESIWTELRVAKHKTVLFCSFYRPPTKLSSELDKDLDELENQLQSAVCRYSGLTIFCGDFNCNLNVSGGGGDRLVRMMSRYGLDHSMRPGSVTYRPSKSLLDVIFTNHHEYVLRSGTLVCHFSPHNFTRALFRVKKTKPKPKVVTCRAWSKVSWEAVRLDLALSELDQTSHLITLEERSNAFTDIVMSVFNAHAPVKTIRIRRQSSLPLKADTLQLLSRRRAAERNGSHFMYKQLNKQCKSAIRRDCRDDVIEQLRERGQSATWSIARSLLSGSVTLCARCP